MYSKSKYSYDRSINVEVDLVIATGGRPMVKAAYSSGMPALDQEQEMQL